MINIEEPEEIRYAKNPGQIETIVALPFFALWVDKGCASRKLEMKAKEFLHIRYTIIKFNSEFCPLRAWLVVLLLYASLSESSVGLLTNLTLM